MGFYFLKRGNTMVIDKILNNNVVVSLDEKQREVIVMGRGIAFKKKCGDEVEDDMIDKVFTLSNEDIAHKFQELLAEIPIEHMELSDEIIAYAKTHLGKKLNESIYLSLSDHIYTSIQRKLDGVVVRNALLWDIRRFYKDEFAIGCKALEMVKETFAVDLPQDEAGFIALHIVNAEMDEDIQTVYDITKVMQEIANIVKYFFQMEFDEDSVYYYRFITHLKFFSQRLMSGKTHQDDNDDDLLDVIRVKYKNAYACVNTVAQFIVKKYNYIVSDEERLYLTIHIARIVHKNSKECS